MTEDAKMKNTEIDNTDIEYDYSTFRAPVNNRYNGKKIYGWFSEPDIQWYRNTVADLYDGLMVEIGVWQGASLLRIADICAKNRIRQIGIDPAFHNEDELKQLIHELGYTHIELMGNYSYNVKDTFQKESIDFVFIDGDHYFESVLKDMTDWYDKVRKGGIMAGHDYLPNGGWPENYTNKEEAYIPEGFEFKMEGVSQAVAHFTAERNLEFQTDQNIWWINK